MPLAPADATKTKRRVCDEADLVEYRDMLHEIRDRMQDLVNVQHLTLGQVKEQRPEIGELVIESYRVLAPKKLTALLDEPGPLQLTGL